MPYNITIVDSGISNDPPVNTVKNSDKKISFGKNKTVIARINKIELMDVEGKPVWKNPLIIQGRVNEMHHLSDRLLITTWSNEYTAWGMLGPTLLIDCNKGEIIKEFQAQSAAILNDDQFILGLEGYGVFKTWLYDTEGNQLQEWNSFGHYSVQDNDEILVFETDRIIPTNAHAVKLLLDGSIEKGTSLHHSQISAPFLLPDGNYLIFDSGWLRIIDTNLKEVYASNIVTISSEDNYRFHSNITAEADKIQLHLYERSKDTPRQYFNHYWLLEILPID